MDGSAGPLYSAAVGGHREQNAPKKFIRILHAVEAKDGDTVGALEPHNGFKSREHRFDHPFRQGPPGRVRGFLDDVVRQGR